MKCDQMLLYCVTVLPSLPRRFLASPAPPRTIDKRLVSLQLLADEHRVNYESSQSSELSQGLWLCTWAARKALRDSEGKDGCWVRMRGSTTPSNLCSSYGHRES